MCNKRKFLNKKWSRKEGEEEEEISIIFIQFYRKSIGKFNKFDYLKPSLLNLSAAVSRLHHRVGFRAN